MILAAMAMLMPMTASAYVPPDQYVYVDDYGLPPPTARHAQDRVEAQNALYAERRQQQTGTYTTTYGEPTYPSVVSGSGQPGYVVIDPPHDTLTPDPALGQALDDLIMSVDDLSATVAGLQANTNRPASRRWVEPPAPVWEQPRQQPLPRSGAGTWLLLTVGGLAAAMVVRKVRATEIA